MRHCLISAFMVYVWVVGVCAGHNEVAAQVYYTSYYYPAQPVYYSSYYSPVSYATPVYYTYYSPDGSYASTVYCEPSYTSEQSYSSQESYSNEQSYATQQPAESSYSVARPAPEQAATTVTIAVHDNSFSPQRTTIQPGTTVRWENHGQHRHTVTANNASWDSGDLKPGDSYLATFKKPGSYYYYCRHHTGERMQGIVIVASTATNETGHSHSSGY